jgi:hypothetical protein
MPKHVHGTGDAWVSGADRRHFRVPAGTEDFSI